MMEEPIFQIENLRYVYNGRLVLDIPDLTVPKSSIFGLMGPNGSGKSTFLKLLGFIEVPTKGHIRYKGRVEHPFSGAVLSKVTLLPQTPYLMKRSVRKNVAYGLFLKKIRGIDDRVDEALDMVGLDPGRFGNRNWNELSGGEAQRVALAARLALRPEVLLLDEPISGVDAASIVKIQEASLTARREWGTTLVIAGHDRQWLHDCCDRVLHLLDGRIFGAGYETLLFGPWRQRNDGWWEKKSSPGHMPIPVSKPPHENAVAVIPPDAFSIDPKGDSSNGNHTKDGFFLEGLVVWLGLSKGEDRIAAAIRAGETTFTVFVKDRQNLEGRDILPGCRVSLFYDPLGIVWL